MHGAADLAENSPAEAHQRFGSHRRVQIIRSALRNYRACTPGQSRSSLTWPELAGIIEADTGVEFGAEALRRFVNGTQVPQQDRLEAMFRFLAQPEVAALDPATLDGDEVTTRAQLALQQYLMQAFDREPVQPPPELSGSYRARFLAGDRCILVDMTLDVPADGPLLLATEIARTFDAADMDRVDATDEREWPRLFRSQQFSSGWGVATPEDNLLLFMKRGARQQNHYWSRTAELGGLSDPSLNRLVMLRQDYPTEVDEAVQDDDVLRAAVIDAISRKIGVFTRRSDP